MSQPQEVEVIPGTFIMHDHDGVHLETNRHNIVLVPQPSSSPEDPLNWSSTWKFITMISQAVYLFICVAPPISMSPMLPAVVEELNITSDTAVTLLITTTILSLGYANFIIVPCSNIFGRRITGIVCATLGTAVTIWEATAKDYKSLLGARITIGIVTATNESLMVQVIADTLFVHERGLWSGIYITVYFCGIYFGPIISGRMEQTHGWRSFFWLYTGLQALTIFVLLFGSPETRWDRVYAPSPNLTESVSVSPAADDVLAAEDVKESSAHTEVISPRVDEEMVQAANHRPVGRPSKKQFALWQPVNKKWKRELFSALIAPWGKFLNPIVLWAGLMVGQPPNTFLFWVLNQNQLFLNPPYNFTADQVGLTAFGFVIGGLIGLFTAGPLSDWVSKWMTRRNNGVREAEFRLLALIPFCITAVCSVILGGLAYQGRWPWPAVVILAYVGTGLCTSSFPTIAIAYATECYNPVAGDIMVVVTVIKNTLGFVETYWVNGLVESKGIFITTLVQGSTVFLPMLLSAPLFIWGKKIRRFTRNSSWHKQSQT